LSLGSTTPSSSSSSSPSSSPSISSLASGVRLVRSCSVDCAMMLLWGVDVRGFYRKFDSYSWRDLLRDLNEGRVFEGEALESKLIQVKPCQLETFVATTNVASGALGSAFPRTRYPLVTVMGVTDYAGKIHQTPNNLFGSDRDLNNSCTPRVIAIVTMFHVPDDDEAASKTPTHVMFSFVVTTANQKLRLQPYIPSGSPAEVVAEEEEKGRDELLKVDATGNREMAFEIGDVQNEIDRERTSSISPNLFNPEVAQSNFSINALNNSLSQRRVENCSVCLSLPVTVVTLPCRHAAICNQCLPRLKDKRCPICRGVIQTHFELEP